MNIGSEVSCLPAIVMKETLFLAYTICQSGYANPVMPCCCIHRLSVNSQESLQLPTVLVRI